MNNVFFAFLAVIFAILVFADDDSSENCKAKSEMENRTMAEIHALCVE